MSTEDSEKREPSLPEGSAPRDAYALAAEALATQNRRIEELMELMREQAGEGSFQKNKEFRLFIAFIVPEAAYSLFSKLFNTRFLETHTALRDGMVLGSMLAGVALYTEEQITRKFGDYCSSITTKIKLGKETVTGFAKKERLDIEAAFRQGRDEITGWTRTLRNDARFLYEQIKDSARKAPHSLRRRLDKIRKKPEPPGS